MTLACHLERWIYVRVPRTASGTFVQVLRDRGAETERRIDQHANAMQAREAWPECWDAYTTFGYVRNPWAWLVSMYNANLSNGARGKEILPGGAFVARNPMHRSNMPFEDWVLQRQTINFDWLTDEDDEVIVDEVRKMEDFIKTTHVHLSHRVQWPYQSWYTPELRDHVAKKFGRVIQIGEYEF